MNKIKTFRIYIDVVAETEEEAFKQADEMLASIIPEESTISNSFSIREIK